MGFCGYTTFSTFAQETLDLLKTGDAVVAVLNRAANVVIGVLAVALGLRPGNLV
jgi:CrcB protein